MKKRIIGILVLTTLLIVVTVTSRTAYGMNVITAGLDNQCTDTTLTIYYSSDFATEQDINSDTLKTLSHETVDCSFFTFPAVAGSSPAPGWQENPSLRCGVYHEAAGEAITQTGTDSYSVTPTSDGDVPCGFQAAKSGMQGE